MEKQEPQSPRRDPRWEHVYASVTPMDAEDTFLKNAYRFRITVDDLNAKPPWQFYVTHYVHKDDLKASEEVYGLIMGLLCKQIDAYMKEFYEDE